MKPPSAIVARNACLISSLVAALLLALWLSRHDPYLSAFFALLLGVNGTLAFTLHQTVKEQRRP